MTIELLRASVQHRLDQSWKKLRYILLPREWVQQLLDDHARLLRGEFTAEEIHNFCHNLHGTVPAYKFADGCAAEQMRLYGRAPDREERDHYRKQLEAVHAAVWEFPHVAPDGTGGDLAVIVRSRLKRLNDLLSDQ